MNCIPNEYDGLPDEDEFANKISDFAVRFSSYHDYGLFHGGRPSQLHRNNINYVRDHTTGEDIDVRATY